MWKLGAAVVMLGVLLGIGNSLDVYGQVRKIVGTAADISPPPPPVGCTPASTFNIVAGTGATTTNGVTGIHAFGVVPNYQNFIGAMFKVGRTAGGNMFIDSVIAGTPPVFTSSVQFSTAGNPVISNTYGSIPDIIESRFLVHATRIVAPCNINSCLQLLLYGTSDSGPFIVSDITFSSIDSGQSSLGGIADATHFYFFQRNRTATATNVFKFTRDSSLSFVGSASIGNVSPEEMIDVGTEIWGLNASTGGVLRINKESLTTQTTTPITGIGAGLLGNLVLDPVNNHLYVATFSAGITTIRQVNSTTFAVTGLTNSLGTESLLQGGLFVDVVADKVYAATDVTGTTARLRRYSGNSFVAEQTVSMVTGIATQNAWQDYIHKRIWVSGLSAPSYVAPFTLCS